jgi:hypothetical protein
VYSKASAGCRERRPPLAAPTGDVGDRPKRSRALRVIPAKAGIHAHRAAGMRQPLDRFAVEPFGSTRKASGRVDGFRRGDGRSRPLPRDPYPSSP